MAYRIKNLSILLMWSFICLWIGFSFGHKQNFVKLPFYHIGEIVLYNSKIVDYLGWSRAENGFRWSASYKPRIVFKPSINHFRPKTYKISINLKNTVSRQRLILFINNIKIGNTAIEGKNIIKFSFNSNILINNSKNVIEFSLPDSITPNENEKRLLSIAIAEFSITE